MKQIITDVTLLFLGLSVITFFYNKRFTIIMINEICINSRYYPKHYCAVPRWVKKCFKVKQKTIPKFLCFEFYIMIFYVIMGLIDIIVSIFSCVKNRFDIVYILFMIYCCIILIKRIHFIIMSLIYKYNTKEKKNNKAENQSGQSKIQSGDGVKPLKKSKKQ